MSVIALVVLMAGVAVVGALVAVVVAGVVGVATKAKWGVPVLVVGLVVLLVAALVAAGLVGLLFVRAERARPRAPGVGESVLPSGSARFAKGAPPLTPYLSIPCRDVMNCKTS